MLIGWAAFEVLQPHASSPLHASYCLVVLLGAVLLVNIQQMIGAYSPERIRQPLAHVHDVGCAILLTSAILIAAAFFTGTAATFGRVWALVWISGVFFFMLAIRLALHLLLGQLRPTAGSGWLCRNIAVVGPAPEAARFVAHLAEVSDPSVRLVGVYDDRPEGWSNLTPGDLPVAGRIEDLCTIARELPIDRIYVVKPWSREGDLAGVLRQLECLPVDIRLQLPPLDGQLLNRRVSYLQGVPFINIADRPLGEWGCLIKRIEDWIIALTALVLCAPMLALIALAIKLDSPGEVLFRQKRYGLNHQLIEVLKFRTMRQELSDANASTLTRPNDPRVTAVGRFLRRTSLDELPQLINVLRGEMSIVGPRPHAIEAKAANRYYHDIVSDYAARHKIKPGITGWAQVNGWRGPTDTEEQLRKRVEHDLFYLNNWSLGFDLQIVAMTLYRGFVSKNAF